MKNIIRRSVLTLVILQVITLACLSQEVISLNLYKLTLNDLPIKDLTLDKVTDLLGRPTATYAYDIESPSLYYHNLGLEFMFTTTRGSSQKIVSAITVHLVKVWDEDNSEFYQPYKGETNPKLNPNIKLKDLPPLFKEYSIKEETAKQRYDSLVKETGKYASYVDDYAGLLDDALKHDVTTIENSIIRFVMFGEVATKFLDEFTIAVKPQISL